MRQKLIIICCLLLAGLTTLAPAKILFDSARDSTVQGNQQDANYEIYIMNDDGSNVQNITNNPLLEEDARWSPDGKQIAFVRDLDNRLSHVMQTDIFIRDVRGTCHSTHTLKRGGLCFVAVCLIAKVLRLLHSGC